VFWAGKTAALAAAPSASLARLIGFLGAGVYEELLFRLILLGAAAWILRRSGTTNRTATVAAVLATSVVFAAAHYVGSYGEAILWREFGFWYGVVFRFLAGVFFSVLFVVRGFGIAAGAHAGYDILVKLL
jgi:membrane protease YdiL (CAAX protease family)